MTLTIDTQNKTILIHGSVNVRDFLQVISGLQNMEEYSVQTKESPDTAPWNPVERPVWRSYSSFPWELHQYEKKDPLSPPFILTCDGKTCDPPCQ